MRNTGLFLAAVWVGVSSGCSGGSVDMHSKDPAAYARTIKQQVREFVQEAARNPALVRKEAPVLLETLEAYPTQPVGEHEATYAQLAQKCKELIEAAQTSGSGSAAVNKKLGEMAALADKLPGAVQR